MFGGRLARLPADLPDLELLIEGRNLAAASAFCNAFAGDARLRPPSLQPLSPLFHRVLNRMKSGEHRGGMMVRAKGLRAGVSVVQSWHLLAEGDDGPYIPSVAIEAIIRKLLQGERPAVGARAATHALQLADDEPLFEGRYTHTGFRHDGAGASLYQRVLGTAYSTLPASVQALHAPSAPKRWYGNARVERGSGMLSRLLAGMFGFPPRASRCRSWSRSPMRPVASAGRAPGGEYSCREWLEPRFRLSCLCDRGGLIA